MLFDDTFPSCLIFPVIINQFLTLRFSEPGEFEFECPAYKTDGKNGALTTTVIRQKGCDGTVRIEYSTM